MNARTVFAIAAVLALSACDSGNESPKPEAAKPTAAPAAAEPAAAKTGEPSDEAAEAPTAKVESSFYALTMQPSGEYVVGKEAKVEAVLEARAGYHCNDEYPYKFKLVDAPEGVSYPDKVAKSIERGKEKSVLSIPFTATSAGKKEISGTFYFSVCNDQTCKIEKKKLALAVDVGES